MKPSLQVKARHSPKLYVCNQEAGLVVFGVFQERLGGEKASRVVPDYSQKPAQGLAHAFVVVYDRDERRDLWHLTSMTENADAMV